jgi:hypothetical protein
MLFTPGATVVMLPRPSMMAALGASQSAGFGALAESPDDAEASHVPAVSLLSRRAGSVKRSDDLLAERGWAHGPSTFGAFQ